MRDEAERRKLKAQAIVGVEALVDEATGYQDIREKDALRKRFDELGGDASDYSAPDVLPQSERDE